MNMQEENRKLLELYAPLRVADVRDGMDWMGYHHYGTLASDIRPLWRTRASGIAVQNQLFNSLSKQQRARS